LGLGRTVAELENSLGSSELVEWQRFWAREPWGAYRDNIHAGLIASTLANAFRGKGGKAITYQDFMLVDRADHKQKKTKEFLGWLGKVAQKKKNYGR
jgi:hypothetical protein